MPESPLNNDLSMLQAEVDDLRARLEQLTSVPGRDAHSSTANGEGQASDGRTGRREIFKVAGAAAIGALGASTLRAAPAGATTGTMMFGASNDAGLQNTSLTSTASSGTLQVTNTANGGGVAVDMTPSTNDGIAVSGSTVGNNSAISGVINNAGSSSAAVYGSTNGTGQGVTGVCTGMGYGVFASGGLAPILLSPAGSAGAPTGAHLAGEIYVDSNGVFYKCVVAGIPGTWVALYSVIPLSAPVRVISTPSGGGNTGGLTGPFAPDGTTHTTGVLTGGATGIPDIAVGVVANLAISGDGATLNGDGYLTLWPAGPANPGTSSLNAGGGAFATSNGVTVAFGTGPDAGKLSFSWQGGGSPLPCQVVLDVTAFIL